MSRDSGAAALGAIALRLPARTPFDAAGLLEFFALRAVPGVEQVEAGSLRRSLRLTHGSAIVELTPRERHVDASLWLADLRDLGPAVSRCRALFDLDADPLAVDQSLGRDELLAPLVRRAPGRRVPGAVDGFEIAVRAVLGQQVSVASARRTAARLAADFGEPLARPDGALACTFPSPQALAGADSARLPMPQARATALRALARAAADGDLDLRPGADRDEARHRLLAIRGIGPWTAEYVAMRALADPDAFPATDLGVLRGLAALGAPAQPPGVVARAERWRPWRAYAVQHLWAAPPSKDA